MCFFLQGHRDSGEHAHEWEDVVGNDQLGGFVQGPANLHCPNVSMWPIIPAIYRSKCSLLMHDSVSDIASHLRQTQINPSPG
jgi:hypothetical protein